MPVLLIAEADLAEENHAEIAIKMTPLMLPCSRWSTPQNMRKSP
jgi:hypothetical protein